MSLIWPVAHAPITQRWGERPDYYRATLGIPYHNGVDWGAGEGTPVVAIAAGEVAWVDSDEGYGLYVRVWHPALRLHSFMAHLSGSAVIAGQQVVAGQLIGYVGSSGHSTGPHLHFELRLATADGEYAEGTWGHSKGRVDPMVIFALLGS